MTILKHFWLLCLVPLVVPVWFIGGPIPVLLLAFVIVQCFIK